ncbi:MULTISPECIES: hypothetical protein [unclassified Streptomyces]|uniref:hypothetical protein n=1 Tax=unclassified Streptomyces TaxID=2593676 RepID=UPI000A1DBD02|nr:hypothetical protein [Streptomyces sp. 13-12-16]OSP43585.1 hypothetical protein B7767_09440 [Streptomyces sp. 13-12-16]
MLGVTAEIVEPLGDQLKEQGFLGGSFAALIALILFDAVGDSEPQEVDGVYALTDLEDLRPLMREAFDARHIRVDFFGFTMQTLLNLLREHLNRLGDEEVSVRELTLRITIAHLNLSMNLPAKLVPAPGSAGLPDGTFYFRDSPENRERMREGFTRRNWNELKDLLDRVHAKNPDIRIACEIRESLQVPDRKLYILNQEKVFSAPYGIKKREIDWRGSRQKILDPEGFSPRHGNVRIIGWDRRSTSHSTREIAEHYMEWHRNLWEELEQIKPEEPVIDDPQWVPREHRPH